MAGNSRNYDEDQVVLTICFCDENCSAYNSVKNLDKEGKEAGGRKHEETKKSKTFETRIDLVKSKIVDCRQVRIPASINVVSGNKKSEKFRESIGSNDRKCKEEPKIYRANGMQDCTYLINKKCRDGKTKTSYTDLNVSLMKPDMVVMVNGTEFKCSSHLLKKYSGFFRDIDIDETCLVYLCGVCINEETFSAVYTWMQMYVRDPARVVDENNLVDVMCACLLLMLNQLEIECWEMVCDPDTFRGEKAYKIYTRSIDKHFHQVTETVFDRALRFFPVLINTSVFLMSKFNHIYPLLKSDDVNCNSEMEIFLAVCKWIMFETEQRWQYLADLVDCIRFGLMTPEQLCCLHLSEVTENIRAITSDPHTTQKIESGIIFNSLKAEYNFPRGNRCGFFHKCTELGVEVPVERSKSDRKLQNCICHKKL